MTTTEITPITRIEDGTEVPVAGAYALDASHSHVGFSVRHAMVSRTKGQFSEVDGTVHIASSDAVMAEKAIAIIKGLTTEPEVGEFYLGVVKRLAEFGAFVEILPGTDGLLHISELDDKRVRTVNDICKEGDEMLVKVIGIDRATGKIRLSRKEALGKTPEVVHNFRNAS